MNAQMNCVFQEGYAVIGGVFTPNTMATLEGVLATDSRAAIDWVMAHQAIQEIAHDLIGPTLARTGEENANVNPAPDDLYTGWHHDYPWDAEPPYCVIPVWRFGVYFRDYTKFSGGLAVAPGSHLGGVSLPQGTVYVASSPGDVVVWNLRTLHSAGFVVDGKPVATPRNAIFFDFGAPGAELDRYVDWRKERQTAKES